MRPGASQPGKSSSDPDRAQRTRSSARKVQLSLKTGSPSLRRAWQAYNHALEEVSKEENSRPVENNKLLLGVPAAPLSFNFFWSSTDIYLISHLGSRMGAQGSSCGGECDAVPDEETLRLMRRSQSAATRRAAEGWCAGLYCVIVEACVDKLQ